jgi:ankyrin repeat protein
MQTLLVILALAAFFAVIYLLDRLPTWVRYRRARASGLIKAAKAGHVEGVRSALKNGANPDAVAPFLQQTALHIAAVKGYDEVILALLDGGAQIDLMPNTKTALAEAFFSKQATSMKLLLERGAEPNCYVGQGKLPLLYCAAEKRDVPTVELLLQYGARDDLPCSYGVGKNGCGVSPDVVKQLVKETLATKDPKPCDLCAACQCGLLKDFVVLRVEGFGTKVGLGGKPILSKNEYDRLMSQPVRYMNRTGTSDIWVENYRVIGSYSVFICDECVKSKRGYGDQSGEEFFLSTAQEKIGRVHVLESIKDGAWTCATIVWPSVRWYRKVKEWEEF